MNCHVSQGILIGGGKQVLHQYFDEAFKTTCKILKKAKHYKEIKISTIAGPQAMARLLESSSGRQR